jgi:hypothetical protein
MDEKGAAQKEIKTLANFDKLLEKLSVNGNKPEVYYDSLHRKLENYFRLKGVNQPDAAADESLDRLARLIEDKHDTIEQIERLSYKIAGFVYHEFHRAEMYEERATDGYRQTLLAFEPEGEAEKEKRLEIQERCLLKLPEDERRLLHDYYKEGTGKFRDQWREQLAKSQNQSKGWLRVKVLRIRTKLEKLLENESAE